MKASSLPYSPGALVSCLDSTGDKCLGIVIDCRHLPDVYRDSAGNVPVYEVDVLFSRLNSFLKIIAYTQAAARKRISEENLVDGVASHFLTVSDSLIQSVEDE